MSDQAVHPLDRFSCDEAHWSKEKNCDNQKKIL